MSDERYFTTDAGVRLEIRPVPPLLIAKVQQAAQKAAEAKFPGTPPTYEQVDGGGGVELIEHDDATAETPEDKAALAAYRATLKKRTDFANDRFMKFLLMKGVAIELPADDSWAREQALFDIDIPTDPSERKLHYIQTELIGVVGDLSGLSVEILSLSGVGKEAIDAARASFRGDLRAKPGSGEAGESGQPGGEVPAQNTRPEVVDESALLGAESGAGLGAYAVAMG